MRKAFIKALCDAAETDSRVWLLTDDLGHGIVEPFADRYPARFLNCGVTEQSMMGIAAGLALDGRVPFVYGISNFVTLRCFEQIRNDIAYHRLTVTILGVGRDKTYGSAGFSHWGVEDCYAMQMLPGMWVVVPDDPSTIGTVVKTAIGHAGPTYIQIP